MTSHFNGGGQDVRPRSRLHAYAASFAGCRDSPPSACGVNLIVVHSIFVLALQVFTLAMYQSINVPSQNPDVGGSYDVCISSLFQSTDYTKWLNTICSFQPSKKC